MNHTTTENDEIDIRQLFSVLYKRRKFILLVTGITILIVVAFTFFLPDKYESEAVLSVSTNNASQGTDELKNYFKNVEPSVKSVGIDIVKYKAFYNAFNNDDRFKAYLNKYYPEFKKADWNKLFEEGVTPVYVYDDKNVVVDKNDRVLGIKIKVNSKNKLRAVQKVNVVQEYLKTIMLNMQIWEYYKMLSEETEKIIGTNKNKIFLSEIEIADLKEKESLILNQLIQLGNKDVNNRQVVQVNKESEKYLSPAQQLISVKVAVKDKELEIKNLRREIATCNILSDYHNALDSIFEANEDFWINRNLLIQLKGIRDNYFINISDSSESYKEANFILDNKISELENLWMNVYKFISTPVLPESPISNKKGLIVLATLFLALTLTSIWVLIREWWVGEESN